MLLCLPVLASAQSSSGKKIGWRSYAAGGIAVGDKNNASVFQLGTGMKYKWLYAGLGVGYDNYRYSSVPVYAEFRADDPESNRLFGYGQVGYSIDCSDGEFDFWAAEKARTTGGLYLDLGIGYRVLLIKPHAVSISLGYGLKKMKESSSTYAPCGGPGPCTVSGNNGVSTNYHKFGRLIAKVAFELGW